MKRSADNGVSVGARALNFRFLFGFFTVFYNPHATHEIHPDACFLQRYNIGAYRSCSNVYQTRPVVELFATVKVDFDMKLPNLTWPLPDNPRDGAPAA